MAIFRKNSSSLSSVVSAFRIDRLGAVRIFGKMHQERLVIRKTEAKVANSSPYADNITD